LDGTVARRRVVQLGAAADGRVEVRDGLRAGEVVLLPEGKPLSDGQTVNARLR